MGSFRFFAQHDSMQCGVACIQMICYHYGKSYTSSYLTKLCGITHEGATMYGLSQAAQTLGFATNCYKLDITELSGIDMPCILYLNHGHFVVLYKKTNDVFYIADPKQGKVKYNLAQLKDKWCSATGTPNTGIVLELIPSNIDKNIIEQCKESHSLGFLMKYIYKFKQYYLQFSLGLLLACVLQLFVPFLTQSIVDVGIKERNISFVWLVLIGEFLIILSKTCADFIRGWILLHVSMRINISLISDFFIKLLRLPMQFFDIKLQGDIIQRMEDYNKVQVFLTSQTFTILFSMFNFLVFACVLLFYSKLIFTIFLIGSLIYGLWIYLFLNIRKVLNYEQFEAQAQSNNVTMQFITFMQEIKLQNCERRRRWEWENYQADLFEIQSKKLKYQQIQEAGNIFINEAKNLLITAMSAMAVIDGNMSLGMMLSVQYIIGQLNAPVEQLMNYIYAMQDVNISLERINEIHSMDDEDDANAQMTNIKDNSIHLDNVNFKYDKYSDNYVLKNVNFTIPQGKVTAIVGTSGSGKTTLLKLLLGYYSLESGAIRIGNDDLSSFNKKWWRQQCGVVMQDGVIFSESIARNIAIDDQNIDLEKMEKSAKMAVASPFIEMLSSKYETVVGQDGIGLSMGQKQRILIARALYKNPSFLFLDEATNSLDTQNEKMVVENLKKAYEGRTVIIVAHRLSTVKNADQIVVIHNGKVEEIGDHKSLVRKKGKYYSLVKNQLDLDA